MGIAHKENDELQVVEDLARMLGSCTSLSPLPSCQASLELQPDGSIYRAHFLAL